MFCQRFLLHPNSKFIKKDLYQNRMMSICYYNKTYFSDSPIIIFNRSFQTSECIDYFVWESSKLVNIFHGPFRIYTILHDLFWSVSNLRFRQAVPDSKISEKISVPDGQFHVHRCKYVCELIISFCNLFNYGSVAVRSIRLIVILDVRYCVFYLVFSFKVIYLSIVDVVSEFIQKNCDIIWQNGFPFRLDCIPYQL